MHMETRISPVLPEKQFISGDFDQQHQQMKETQPSDGSKHFLTFLSSAFPCFGIRNEPDQEGDSSLHSASSKGGYPVNNTSVRSTGFTAPVLPENDKALNFTMAELSKATSNFSLSCKIGQGGFGIVYRGRLTDGTDVAIKRARKDAFGAQLTAEFQREVDMLASVEHLHLVKLIGYLEEGNERIVVEEYVPNGNLRQHLNCELGLVLGLSSRLQIAIDIAHALTYLHHYAGRPIIHRDVKASNILLTKNLRAKVADFGFSRTGPLDSVATHVSTQVRGTAGYLDPEYLKTYKLTQKSDVYSFGIVLLELVTGRRPIEPMKNIEERITVRWAYQKFTDGNLEELMDPRLEKTEATYIVMGKMAELAFHCSAPTRHDRPMMNKAVEYLWTIRKDCEVLTQGQHQNESELSLSSPRNS